MDRTPLDMRLVTPYTGKQRGGVADMEGVNGEGVDCDHLIDHRAGSESAMLLLCA